jgi:hypothetical protein
MVIFGLKLYHDDGRRRCLTRELPVISSFALLHVQVVIAMKWLCWVLPVLHVNSASLSWRQITAPTAFTPSIVPRVAGFSQCRHPSKPEKLKQGETAAARRIIGVRKAVAVAHPETRGLTDFRDMQAELFKQFTGLFDNADQVRVIPRATS